MATSSGTAESKEDLVISLQKHPFTRRSLEEKKRIKGLGPDRPIYKFNSRQVIEAMLTPVDLSRCCNNKWSNGKSDFSSDFSRSIFRNRAIAC